ncbi:MAG: tRNA (adenosine(37)-N6)-threonylcarbamoyltransferase complex transferase subunit TsaD [Deltaproteobacteria bacterium]|nr:tRNA (adenosine(37)-N6)-threonylcarbamoyltransferase complex transferase subunit TsaD [Deltaproteobacteria bacterium]
MRILGIESSCDDLAICILETPKKILAHQVASQHLHAQFGGIVPEVASREHLKTISSLFQSTLQSLEHAKKKMEGIGVTVKPGLIGSLLVGLNFAKGLALAENIPFIGVSHLEGHLMSTFLEDEIPSLPFLGMVLSGGHTHLFEVCDIGERKLLGCSVDDAAGEAYDKVAKMLGLAYPGGPILDQLAKQGNPKRFHFTPAQVKKGELYTSFSGLKTAVLEVIQKNKWRDIFLRHAPEDFPEVLDLIASFQNTLVKSIERLFKRAHENFPKHPWVIAGGVACNSAIRERLTQAAEACGVKLFIPRPEFCTDNAAMIAYVGGQYLERGISSAWDLNATSNDKQI